MIDGGARRPAAGCLVSLNARGPVPATISRAWSAFTQGQVAGPQGVRGSQAIASTPRPKVYIDEHNRTIVSGKPFPTRRYSPDPAPEGFSSTSTALPMAPSHDHVLGSTMAAEKVRATSITRSAGRGHLPIKILRGTRHYQTSSQLRGREHRPRDREHLHEHPAVQPTQ